MKREIHLAVSAKQLQALKRIVGEEAKFAKRHRPYDEDYGKEIANLEVQINSEIARLLGK